MQKTFSIAAVLTLTGVVAAVAAGIFAGQKRKQAELGIAVTLLPFRGIADSRADPRLQNPSEIAKHAITQFLDDAIASAIGDTVRDVAVESWQMNRSGRSLVIHAKWTDAATDKVSSHKLRLVEVSDGIYAGGITGSVGPHAEEVQQITIELGGGD